MEKQIAAQATSRGISESDVIDQVMLTESAVKRLLEPEEVAELAVYLCSQEAALINGTWLCIDGGWTAQLSRASVVEQRNSDDARCCLRDLAVLIRASTRNTDSPDEFSVDSNRSAAAEYDQSVRLDDAVQ